MSPPSWESWAPPLFPPAEGGLPYGDAEAIAAACWDDDPHLCAALQWESWAATLPPAPSVSLVQTGAQSVSYSPAGPVGGYGLAIARASWHRSFTSTLVSVPLHVASCATGASARVASRHPLESAAERRAQRSTAESASCARDRTRERADVVASV